MKGLKAVDLMTKDVVSITKDTSVCQIARLFKEKRFGSLPVMDGGRVVGIVTKKNILKLFLPRHVKFLDIVLYFESSHNLEVLLKRACGLTAQDIMSSEVVSVTPDTGFANIVAMLFEKKVHQLLVIGGDGLQGIISRLDIINAFERELAKIRG